MLFYGSTVTFKINEKISLLLILLLKQKYLITQRVWIVIYLFFWKAKKKVQNDKGLNYPNWPFINVKTNCSLQWLIVESCKTYSVIFNKATKIRNHKSIKYKNHSYSSWNVQLTWTIIVLIIMPMLIVLFAIKSFLLWREFIGDGFTHAKSYHDIQRSKVR